MLLVIAESGFKMNYSDVKKMCRRGKGAVEKYSDNTAQRKANELLEGADSRQFKLTKSYP